MKTMIKTGLTILAVALTARTAAAQDRHHGEHQIPRSMRDDHEKIQHALQDAMKAPGAVGAAARELERVLHPHFVREEQIALPPLGVLQKLAEKQAMSREHDWILPMTDSLRAELPKMLEEHKAIGAARQRMEAAAQAAGNARVVELSHELAQHALAEEELFYPMAILAGEIVRARGHMKH